MSVKCRGSAGYVRMAVAAVVVLAGVLHLSSAAGRVSPPSCVAGFTHAQLTELTTNMANSSYMYRHLLPNILIPRVPGTEGNLAVREFIAREMREMQWTVTRDTFTAVTPLGDVTFSNVIATHDPRAPRRLVLACHYDSKYMPDMRPAFLGAVDSAVPCAMMMSLARHLTAALTQARRMRLTDMTLQLIFFDGEEAFERWSATDSLYGSRHLAERWAGGNYLDGIEVFVLMDLIGNYHTRFVNYYSNTSSLFYHVYNIERCLRYSRMLTSGRRPRVFDPWGHAPHVEDDHTPFIQRGVKVLHLISTPFPAVWHSPYDTLEYVDRRLVDDVSRILRVFLTMMLFGM